MPLNRKNSYASIILAILILFSSCSQHDIVGLEDTYTYKSFEEYVYEHINLAEQLANALDEEKNIDTRSLLKAEKIIINFENLNKQIKNAQIVNDKLITDILLEIHYNLINLYNYNKLNKNLDKDAFINKFNWEVSNYFKYKDKEFKLRGDCETARDRGRDRCIAAYSVASLAIVATTWWTIGVGTVIGITAATVNLAICDENVNNDYSECISQ